MYHCPAWPMGRPGKKEESDIDRHLLHAETDGVDGYSVVKEREE